MVISKLLSIGSILTKSRKLKLVIYAFKIGLVAYALYKKGDNTEEDPKRIP